MHDKQNELAIMNPIISNNPEDFESWPEDEMELSTCCDAARWLETDLCSSCKEHADFYDDEEPSEDEMEYEISRDIKEQDRLNFQDLLKSEGELDTLTDTYMKDYGEWYEILRLVLKDGDSQEIGERMKKLKEGALFEYLTMLRKPYEGEL